MAAQDDADHRGAAAVKINNYEVFMRAQNNEDRNNYIN